VDVDPRRRVPRTDVVLADPRLVEASARLGTAATKAAVRQAQDAVRAGTVDPAEVVAAVLARLPRRATGMRPVLNATGVIVHTNLGRAPLSRAAVEAMTAAAGYVDVEFDLADGARAGRGRHTRAALLAAVPEAEDALVVNNGAAALILAVTALAAGREVVVSRGELVEIGDGFRLPELIESTGARIREVGTTNRTTRADYAAAVGPSTGCIVKVHPSNFSMDGFVGNASVAELATLDVPLVVDIGSGLLIATPLLRKEPDARSALTDGAGVVTASGDKLLGGPQAGLVLGRAELVQRMRRHPLARALRVDKLTLAALEATVAGPGTPVDAYLRADPGEQRRRCDQIAKVLADKGFGARVVPSVGVVGGGGGPGVELPGWAVALPERFAAPLRTGADPVVGRIERGRCLLDLRCVSAEDDDRIVTAVLTIGAAVGAAVGAAAAPE
jgi:L-seryl-tRNA(Ser) seleniumtransferase